MDNNSNIYMKRSNRKPTHRLPARVLVSLWTGQVAYWTAHRLKFQMLPPSACVVQIKWVHSTD